MTYSAVDLVGNLGVLCILGSYLLLQTGRIQSSELRYSLINGLGAALVLVSLVFEFNLSAFLVEAFWLLISLYGVYRHFAARFHGSEDPQ